MRWALHLVLHLHPSLHLHTVAFPLEAPFPCCLFVLSVRLRSPISVCRVSEF